MSMTKTSFEATSRGAATELQEELRKYFISGQLLREMKNEAGTAVAKHVPPIFV